MDQRQKENGMEKNKQFNFFLSVLMLFFNFVTIFCSILILMFVMFFMINKH